MEPVWEEKIVQVNLEVLGFDWNSRYFLSVKLYDRHFGV
jgi:hypothetical protein